MTGVSFLIVNEQRALSRAMYWELKRRAPPSVPVYQQAPFQEDVWDILDGDKDDFLVYDRCGLLTFHVVLPYSLLNFPYVEAAIRATYFRNICNCIVSKHKNLFLNNNSSQPDQTTPVPSAATAEETNPSHHHHHHHHHHYHGNHHHHHHQSHQHHNHSQPTQGYIQQDSDPTQFSGKEQS
uniref:Selenoprotein P N-terminal domain-containing protein n=1 Tax=Periophthalmus magnuspinnatus TaxID=409849 RepID=A0A3B4B6Z4_9GOBI